MDVCPAVMIYDGSRADARFYYNLLLLIYQLAYQPTKMALAHCYGQVIFWTYKIFYNFFCS